MGCAGCRSGGRVSIRASSREDATISPAVMFCCGRFQSARPRGRTRLLLMRWINESCCFNPRVLAGGRDFKPITFHPCLYWFQSARPRGRTRQLFGWEGWTKTVSIRASSREDAT